MTEWIKNKQRQHHGCLYKSLNSSNSKYTLSMYMPLYNNYTSIKPLKFFQKQKPKKKKFGWEGKNNKLNQKKKVY